jgi:hypothetical protein
MKATAEIRTELYTRSDARNWLTVHDCLLSPTKLGHLEVEFPSESLLLEFSLRWSALIVTVCSQSTT